MMLKRPLTRWFACHRIRLQCAIWLALCAAQGCGVYAQTSHQASHLEKSAVAADPVIAVLETSLGKIEIELFLDQAPLSAGSFLKIVRQERFDNAGFYRVVRPDNDNGYPLISVIQGGVLDTTALTQADLVDHETTKTSGILHTDGVVSLARSEPGSGTGATFFICIGDQPSLDFGGQRNLDGQGFAAFGRVVGGMDVVRAINGMSNTQSSPDPYTENQILAQPVRFQRVYLKE